MLNLMSNKLSRSRSVTRAYLCIVDLAGVKETEKLSPEEQELAEEAASPDAQQTEVYSDGQAAPPPGQPNFLFVAHISDADRDKAMAEAYGKAKANAALLAKAAGRSLGPLSGLSGNNSNHSLSDEEAFSSYGPGNYAIMQMRNMVAQRNAAAAEDQSAEVVGTNPTSLSFDFAIQAVFTLGAER